MSIDDFKHNLPSVPHFILSNANVYVSPKGYHVIDYLDPIEAIDPKIDYEELTEEARHYIEKNLQYNPERFANQVVVLERECTLDGKRVIDIGCGGGEFLVRARNAGALVEGVELSDARAAYSEKHQGIELTKRPIEDSWWESRYGQYDVVTLWDVIEHVNYPEATLKAANALLKPGGILAIDTPSRDSFYHQFGEMTYKLTGGKAPTFLNSMYSAHLFGHKQILSTEEMRALFENLGLEVRECSKFHELSFPYHFYLKKMVVSETLAKLLSPMASIFFSVFKIRNKMLVIGKKSS